MTLVFTLGFLKDIKKNAEMMSLNCNSLYIFCRKMTVDKQETALFIRSFKYSFFGCKGSSLAHFTFVPIL